MADEAAEQFCGVTGADAATAARFLAEAGGDAAEAVERFFEAGAGAGPSAAPAAAAPPAAARKAPAPRGGVRGLGDLAASDEEEEEDGANEYYVGGDKSGQVVKGAPRPEDAEGLFEAARAAGAREGRPEDLAPRGAGAAAGGGFAAFTGRGRTLAGGAGADEAGSSGAGADAAPAPAAAPAAPTVKAVTITVWRGGVFTVDGGPPRRLDDPTEAAFVGAISRGQCPPELDPGDPAVQLAVNMVRRDEEYRALPPPRYRAFAGAGNRLDGGAPPAAAAAPSPAAAAAAAAAATAAAAGGPTWAGADPTLPKTSLQLRLADGSRLVAEFNLAHTVGDVRRFIAAARPGGPAAYRLATAFPPAALEDDSATLQAVGLANAVVVQKL
jgi:UBX domain-containing protein 1